MNLHILTAPPPAWLGEAMETFERQFTYPLGTGGYFHVSHGRQYLCFFQAMGDARVYVMEREGKVYGTVALIRRPLRQPDGSDVMAYYVCDLKVAPGRLAGPVLARLMQSVREHVMAAGLGPVYGIVMDGTARTPAAYTGRVGIPSFQKIGELAVLRIPLASHSHHEMPSGCRKATREEVMKAHERLSPQAWVPRGSDPARRSEMIPAPLVCADGEACGVVEDTRLGKRLVLDDGSEMKAAHLSCFAFSDVEHGLLIIQAAMSVAEAEGFPALFVALPGGEHEHEHGPASCADLRERLVREWGVLLAPAMVYGTGFDASPGGESNDAVWWVGAAEI